MSRNILTETALLHSHLENCNLLLPNPSGEGYGNITRPLPQAAGPAWLG